MTRVAHAKIVERLQKGIALHNAGNLPEAEKLYRRVLKDAPRHADALHLMALLSYSRKEYVSAVRYSELALAENPRIANFYNTAGEAMRMLGAVEEAVVHLEKAVALDPRLAQAHHNLSLCYQALSRVPEARRACAAALSLRPIYPEALAHGLAMAVAADDEAECLRIAEMLRKVGSREADRTLAGFHLERARKTLERRDYDAAEREARTALELASDHWGVHEQLAIIAHHRGQPAAAETLYRAALDLDPENREARLNLAHFLVEEYRFDEAERIYHQVLDEKADEPSARYGLAGIHLFRDDYAKAWPYYEARWDISGSGGARFGVAPPWDGAPLESLLLYCEQGYGDTLQMLRFLPEVRHRAKGTVALHVPAALQRLAKRFVQDHDIQILSGTTLQQPFAAECALMSIPGILGVRNAAEAGMVKPYLSCDANRLRAFSNRLDAHPGVKAGIVWQGSSAGQTNVRRMLAAEMLAPVLERPGLVPVSLQFGVETPVIAGKPLIDLSGMIADFDDLSAAIMAVDIVITVDSAPAHLAGALGKQTFVLVPWLHDWRWGVSGTETPWYPSLTLVRQEMAGDWREPVARLMSLLDDAMPRQIAAVPAEESETRRDTREGSPEKKSAWNFLRWRR